MGLKEQKKEQAETGQTWKDWCEVQKRSRGSFPAEADCRRYMLIARFPRAYQKGMSIKEASVPSWLAITTTDIDRQAKEDRNRRILKMWMECYSLDEIGEEVGLTKKAVSTVCVEMADVSKLHKPSRLAATYEDDFEPQRLPPGWPARRRASGNRLHFFDGFGDLAGAADGLFTDVMFRSNAFRSSRLLVTLTRS